MTVPKFEPGLGANFGNVQSFDPAGARATGQLWGQVAQVAQGIVQETNRALDVRAVEQGKKAGEIAGAEQGFDPRSLSEANTLFDTSFREGAVSSYMANLDVESTKALGDMAAKELNPQALSEQMDAYINSTLANIPADLQPAVSQQLRRSAGGYFVNATRRYEEEQRQLNEKNTLAAFELAATAAINIGLPKTEADRAVQAQSIAKANAYLDSLVAQRAIAPAEADLRRQALQKDIYQNTVLAGLDDSSDKLGYIKGIAEGDAGPLSPVERDKLVDRLRAAYNDDIALTRLAKAEQQEQMKAQYAKTLSDLDIKISRGEATEQEIEDLYAKGAMTADARADRIIKLDKERADTESRFNTMERVSMAVTGDTILNPQDAKDKKAVDEYYRTKVLPLAGQMTMDEQIATLTNLVKTTGIVPKTVKGGLLGAFKAGTPEQAAQAANVLDNLLEFTRAGDDFEKRDIALGLEIRDLIRAGVDPTEAVDRARKLHDPANTSVRQTRLEEVGRLRLGEEYQKWATDSFDTVFGFAPSVVKETGSDVALRNDFEAVFRDWYVNTGDQDKAREMATRDIQRSWGVTRVDGKKRLMKYAPEAYYAFNGDSDWLENDLIESVRTMPGYENVEVGDVLLGSDTITQRGAMRGQPDYPVLVKNADGVFEPVIGKRYRPSIEDKKRKNVDEARKLRERGPIEFTSGKEGF